MSDTPSSSVNDLVGQSIDRGRYELIRVIGEGGMGKVYEARQKNMERMVAVKVLHAHWAQDAKLVERFKREALTASKFRHPNTVMVYDYGKTEQGDLYIIMELLKGQSLLSLLDKEGPLQLERALKIIEQIAGAISEVHRCGVIHRDLKPENIQIDPRNGHPDFVKVLDFSIAKIVNDNTLFKSMNKSLTLQGAVFGTPQYMSPEQVRGKALDHRTDIYALGIIFYQMVTGDVPFLEQTPQGTMMAHLTEPIPNIQDQYPKLGLHTDACQLIYDCLRKDPKKRLSSSDSLSKRVKSLLAKLELEAPQNITAVDAESTEQLEENQSIPSPLEILSTDETQLPAPLSDNVQAVQITPVSGENRVQSNSIALKNIESNVSQSDETHSDEVNDSAIVKEDHLVDHSIKVDVDHVGNTQHTEEFDPEVHGLNYPELLAKQNEASKTKETKESQEVSDSKKKIADAKKEIADAKKEIADAKKEIADAKKEVAEAKKEVAEAKKEVAEAKKEVEDTATEGTATEQSSKVMTRTEVGHVNIVENDQSEQKEIVYDHQSSLAKDTDKHVVDTGLTTNDYKELAKLNKGYASSEEIEKLNIQVVHQHSEPHITQGNMSVADTEKPRRIAKGFEVDQNASYTGLFPQKESNTWSKQLLMILVALVSVFMLYLYFTSPQKSTDNQQKTIRLGDQDKTANYTIISDPTAEVLEYEKDKKKWVKQGVTPYEWTAQRTLRRRLKLRKDGYLTLVISYGAFKTEDDHHYKMNIPLVKTNTSTAKESVSKPKKIENSSTTQKKVKYHSRRKSRKHRKHKAHKSSHKKEKDIKNPQEKAVPPQKQEHSSPQVDHNKAKAKARTKANKGIPELNDLQADDPVDTTRFKDSKKSTQTDEDFKIEKIY